MTEYAEADVSIPLTAIEALTASFGGPAFARFVTVLSDVVILRFRFVGWTPDDVVADLRARAGTEEIHLVLDVESEEVSP